MDNASYVPVPNDAELLRSAVRLSFHAVGGLHVLRLLSRSCARILMYHRFPEAHRDSLRRQMAANMPRSDTVKVDTIAKQPAGNTYTMMNGRQIELPKGVTAKQVDAVFAKFRNREQLTPDDQAVMQKLRDSGAFGGMGGGGGNGAGGGGGGRGGFGGRRGGSDFQFGGEYIVFALRAGKPTPVFIRTGLTDLDYSEVVSGLTASDSVLVLPSASLVQSQQEAKNRAAMFGGSLIPGTGTGSQAGRTGTTAAPAAGGAAGGGGRPPGGA